MMAAALSTYYNNWDTLQTPNFEISSSFLEEPTPEELALVAPHYFPHHFAYSDETFFNLPNNSYLTDYPTNNFLYPEINNPSQLLPFTSFHDQQPFISLNEIFPTEHQDLPCPKRQKFEQEAMHMPCNYVVPNYCFQTEDQFSALLQHEVILPPEHSGTNFVVGSNFEKKVKEERTVSAQSVAARERRRKITEKTQELGKLVPGGPKMNTAEMLHAASKYVKFLQAQVQMLQLINTLEEDDKGAPPSEDQLHTLVVSPYVQEKLYSEERCLVPNEFVTTLTNHGDIRSTPSILKDLNQLIGTEIDKKVKQD